MHRKVSWILDADIRGFFDSISHEWMEKFVGHGAADKHAVQRVKVPPYQLPGSGT